MTTFEKLKIKIKEDTGLDLYDFKRTRHSKLGLSSGGFSWVAKEKGTGMIVGSGISATNLLKLDKITIIPPATLGQFTELT